MTDSTALEAHAKAGQRLVDALNARGEPATAEAAISPGVRLERFGFGPRQGQLVQIIEGIGPVTAWLQLTPDGTSFALAEAPLVDDEGVATVRYRLTHEDFVNGGEWRWKLADDGRITWLQHLPNDLPETDEEASARLARRASPMVPNELALDDNDHDHNHD
jgi:hypothetical protein